MKAPEISIITPTYNSEKYLSNCLDSILDQSHTDWELIVIDDNSKDKTKLILKEYQNLYPKKIKLILLEKNIGPGLARNKGIEIAQGEYITFIDSDDIWTKNKIKDHLYFMKKNDLVFSHASYGYIDYNHNISTKTYDVDCQYVTFKSLLKRNQISCLTAIYNQKKIGKYFMSDDRRKQDYFLWLSILKDGHNSFGFNKVQAYYRLHEGQVKKDFNLLLKHFKFLNKKIGLNILASIYYSLYYAYYGVKKYLV